MKRFHHLKRIVALLAVAMSLIGWASPVDASPIRPSEVASPSEGNVLIGIEGNFYAPDRQAIIDRVNAIRKEAYDVGYVNQYVPIKWSRELEADARTRAAEALIALDILA